MDNVLLLPQLNLQVISKHWGWFLGWGIILVGLGILAIAYDTLATLISVVFLGIILAAGGIAVIIEACQFWWGKWGGFFIHAITGILYLALGIMLIKFPVLGSISLTLLIAIFYISLGVFRVVYSLSVHLPNRGWRIFNGILAFILGILILSQWPLSGLFIIGLFIGIDLLFSGWVYIMTALSARQLIKNQGET